MQLKVAATARAPDIAGKHGQGIDESDIFATVLIALHTGADQGGRRLLWRITGMNLLKIRLGHITNGEQMVYRLGFDQIQKFLRCSCAL